MQEKISISLDKSLIEKLDSLIDGISIKKRSQAFEYALREFLKTKEIIKAVILIGGEKAEVDEWLLIKNLKRLIDSRIKDVYIAAGHNYNDIKESIEKAEINSSHIVFFNEPKPLGTAGIIKKYRGYLTTPFLVLLGDIEFDLDIKKMMEFHNNNNSIATMYITPVERKISTDFINIIGNRVTLFEYKTDRRSHITNAGIYIFDPKLLEILPNKGSLERDVFPKLAIEGKLFAFISSDTWKHK